MKKNSIFIGLLLFIVLGAWSAFQVEFSFNLSAFAAKNSKEYQQFEAYTQKFPKQDDWMVVGLELTSSISEYQTFINYVKLIEKLDSNDMCEEVQSIHAVKLPEKAFFGINNRALLKWNTPGVFKKKYESLSKYPDVTSKFLGDSDKKIRFYLKLKTTNSENKNAFIDYLYSLSNQQDINAIYLLGEDISEYEAERQFPKEMVLIGGISLVVLMLLFILFFRDLKSLFIASLLIAFNLSFVLIAFWLTGISIGILTLTVPVLIIVLSFSDIIHFLFHLKRNDSKENRVREVVSIIKYPILWTSITTGLGFAVFLVSNVTEIQEFALITCVGIIGAFLSARFILPLLSTIIDIRPFRNQTVFKHRTAFFEKIQNWNKWIVASGIVVLCGVILVSFRYLSIDMQPDFQKNDSKVSHAMAFFNDHFEGMRSIEVIINDEHVLNNENIEIIDKIESYLMKPYGCTDVFSLNTAVKRLNRFNHYGKAQFYSIPNKLDDNYITILHRKFDELGLENMVTTDNKTLRIIGYLKATNLQEINPKNTKLSAFLSQFESNKRTLFISGNSYINDQTTLKVTQYVLQSLIVALLIAVIIISILFRSIRLIVAILFVNILPLFLASALMVLFHIDLNQYSVMALSIVLGLSVDDTIYFLKSFFKNKGEDASLISIRENAFPIFFTTLILSAGFATLALSNFGQNRDMGIVVSLVLLIAMIADLILLPALLKVLFKNKK